jgi:lipopolysaccharide assembly protein A
MRILLWLVRAFLFFLLFAFALNNQHEAVLKGFFGTEWRMPTVVIVLVSFAAGALLTLAAVLPRLWRGSGKAAPAPAAAPSAAASTPAPRTTEAHADSGLATFDRASPDGV